MKPSIQQRRRIVGELTVGDGEPQTLKRGEAGLMRLKTTEWLRARGLMFTPKKRRKL